jgi:hypothetical protein
VGCEGKFHLIIVPFQSKIFSLVISLKASAWKLDIFQVKKANNLFLFVCFVDVVCCLT